MLLILTLKKIFIKNLILYIMSKLLICTLNAKNDIYSIVKEYTIMQCQKEVILNVNIDGFDQCLYI